MQNIIPPIVSSSPPPLDPIEDDDNDDDENDDAFGDFTTADFSSHNDLDSSISKTISDTSWTLPSSKQSSTKPEVRENGILSHEPLTYDGHPKHHGEGSEDDEMLQNADNTSHDSVVSGVTDSGNCSASQNSNGASPMPNVEVEDEIAAKSSLTDLPENGSVSQLPSEILAANSGKPSSIISDANQIYNYKKIEDTAKIKPQVRPDHLSFEKEATGNSLALLDKNSSDELSSGSLAISDENEQSESNRDSMIPNSENSQGNDLSFVEKNETNNASAESLGVWSCSNVPVFTEPKNLASNETQSNEGWSDLQHTASRSNFDVSEDYCVNQNSTKLDEVEENDCVKAMIIPEMPDFDGDDDFGDFSGKCDSKTESVDDVKEEPSYDSPSRRPTLVLTDDTHYDTATDESQPAFNSVICTLNEPIEEVASFTETFSVVETTSAVNPPTIGDGGSSHPLYPSNDLLEDEFADFTQAEVTSKDSVSDVWAQAAQESTVPSAVPSGGSEEFDDFDDFETAEFQSAEIPSSFKPAPRSLFDMKAIRSSLHKILEESFPIADGGCTVAEMENISSGLSGLILDIEESSTWQGLRDLESTPSLSFQWPGSHSNRGLLGALNIDSRNILFGPKWNTVVPRFAANLGFSPLEPVRAVQSQPTSEPPSRTEIIQPTVEENKKTSPPDQGEVVPAAQFDWSDSGLINPLDSNKDPANGPLATTAASGNPVLTAAPLQVEQLLANSKSSTALPTLDKMGRDPSLSQEAARVLDTLPELAFLSARMLMFPVQGDRNQNKL